MLPLRKGNALSDKIKSYAWRVAFELPPGECIALSHNLCLDIVVEIDSLSVQKAPMVEGNLFTVLADSAIHVELWLKHCEPRGLSLRPLIVQSRWPRSQH